MLKDALQIRKEYIQTVQTIKRKWKNKHHHNEALMWFLLYPNPFSSNSQLSITIYLGLLYTTTICLSILNPHPDLFKESDSGPDHDYGMMEYISNQCVHVCPAVVF